MKRNMDVKVDFTFAELFLMALCWYGWACLGWHITFPIIITAYIGSKAVFVIAIMIYLAIKNKQR